MMTIDDIRDNFRKVARPNWETKPRSELGHDEVARIKREAELEEITIKYRGADAVRPYLIKIKVGDDEIPVVREDTLHETIQVTELLDRILR